MTSIIRCSAPMTRLLALFKIAIDQCLQIQDVEEDWPLQIFDHAGNPHELILAPGDMVL